MVLKKMLQGWIGLGDKKYQYCFKNDDLYIFY